MGKGEWLALALLTLAVALLYLPAFHDSFIWDSQVMFTRHPLLTAPAPLAAAFGSGYWGRAAGSLYGRDYYRPLTTFSFMLQSRGGRARPRELQAVNLALFLAAAWVFALLIRSAGGTAATATGAFLLFSLFPPNLDSVVWEVGRCDLLMLLWGMLAWLFLQRSFGASRRTPTLLLSGLCFLLGTFSKESFLFFLPLLLLIECLWRGRVTPFYHLGNLASALAYLLIRRAVLGPGSFPLSHLLDAGASPRALLGVLGFYGRTLGFPYRHDMFVSLDQVVDPLHLWLGLLTVAAVAGLGWCWRRQKRRLAPLSLVAVFTLGYAASAFAPVFPYSLYARYLMVPAAGAAWLLADALERLKPRARFLSIAALALFLAAALLGQAPVYRDMDSYLARAARSCPSDGFIDWLYGHYLLEKGDFFNGQARLAKALRARLRPQVALRLSLDLAGVAVRQADFEAAQTWLRRARDFRLAPAEERQLQQLEAGIRFQRDQPQPEIARLRALPKPGREDRLELARLLCRSGNAAAGAAEFQAIVCGSPGDADLLNRIGAFYMNDLARPGEALQYFTASLALRDRQPLVRRAVELLRPFAPAAHPKP